MAIEKVVNVKVKEQGFDDLNAKVQRLENSLEDLEQQNDSLRSSLSNSGKSVLDNGGAMGILNEVTGGLAMTVKDAVEATDLFTKSTKAQTTFQKIQTAVMGTSTGALKAFRIALIATGIGAIVVALGLLIANFDKVKKVVMNLIPGLSAIGDLFGSLIDAVTDFIGVTSDATRALDKMVEDSEASLKRSEHFLEANGDKYDEYTNRKIKANIDYNKKVKELAEDELLTEEEKFARLKDFRDKANREIIQADKDRADKLAKARQDERDKINAENQKAIEKREQEAKEKMQRDFEIALAGAEAGRKFDEDQRAIFEANKKLEEEEEEEALNKSIDDLVKSTREKADIQRQLEEQELMAREAFENAKFQIVDQTLSLIGNLAGKSKAVATALLLVEKGLAISQVVTNASRSISVAKANLAAVPAVIGITPNPLYGVQAAATAKGIVTTKISAGLAIANILAQGIGKLSGGGNLGGGGGDSSGGGGGGAPSAPSFNLVAGTGTNQIAQSLAGQNQPLQAFVVGSAVTSQQELDRNQIDTASL
jgi:hypothetical protein